MTALSFRLPVHLDRARLWDGLVRKAEDPTGYISAITGCTVLEHFPDWLLREIVIRGSVRQRERVRFEPPDRIVFDQVTDDALATITNVIVEHDDGSLSLELIIDGQPAALAEMSDYFAGTLREIVDALHAEAGVPR